MSFAKFASEEPPETGQELAEPPSLRSHAFHGRELASWSSQKNFLATHFPGATQKDWDSWRWQL